MKRFEDTSAIITGASDRGIGGAIAERFAEEGAELILMGLTEPKRLLKRLSRRGVIFQWHRVDVTRTEEVEACVHGCYEDFGHIDILVNNAGVEFSKRFEEIKDEEWDHLLSVNLTGAMKMSRAVLPYLTEQGGVIVNIASILGMAGSPGYHAYSASKAGLMGMTQSLALELAPYGQRVVCVSPALVQTPMAYKHRADLSDEDLKKLEEAHPLGIGMPADVADVVAFLASHEARWLSGTSIPLGWIPSFGLPAASPIPTRPQVNQQQVRVIPSK